MTINEFYQQFSSELLLRQLVVRGYAQIHLRELSQFQYLEQVTVPLELSSDVDCVVVHHSTLDEYLTSVCDSQGIALLTTAMDAHSFLHALQSCSLFQSPNSVARYGTLIRVAGQGVLIRGESGSGKSDLALGLVDRGHKLIADDQVEFSNMDGRLVGSCPAGFLGYIEIRGLGIINVMDIYGDDAVIERCELDLVVTLGCDDMEEEARIHGMYGDWQLEGISVPEVLIPYSVSRNMPLLIETAARVNQLRQQGYDAATDFESMVDRLVRQENA